MVGNGCYIGSRQWKATSVIIPGPGAAANFPTDKIVVSLLHFGPSDGRLLTWNHPRWQANIFGSPPRSSFMIVKRKNQLYFPADTSRMLLKICELCSAARWFMRMWGVSLGQWMVWKECFGWCAFELWCWPKKAGLTPWQQRRLPTLTAVSHTSQQLDTHQLPVEGDPSWAVRPRGGKCLLQTNPSATWRRILPSAIPPLPSPGSMLFLLGYIYII